MDEASGPRSLLAIEMNKDSLLPILSIKLPKVPISSLSTLNSAKSDGLQKKNVLKDCSSVIQLILQKLKEKPPLNFNLVRNAVCLVPFNIIQKKNMSVSKFGKLEQACMSFNIQMQKRQISQKISSNQLLIQKLKLLKGFPSMVCLTH